MKKILMILIFILINKNLYSNNLFESSFFEVKFISNNIDEDKIEQIKEIKKKSLLNIFRQTLKYKKYIEINNLLTEDLINTFIKNVIIDDEKVIDNKYFSKIKINFDKKKIINYYRNNNISYIEYFPDKFLLIFYENENFNKNLFSKNNKYYKYFNKSLKNNNNLFKIPNLDINDRYILGENDILNRDLERIKKFSQKYNSNEVIVVISNKKQNKYIFDLILFSYDKQLENKLEFTSIDSDDFFRILEIETLNMWKQLNYIQNEYLNIINCKVDYFNLLELKEIRRNLNNVSIIENLKINSLSYKSIDYNIFYYGNNLVLINILNMNNLKINSINNNCIISLK